MQTHRIEIQIIASWECCSCYQCTSFSLLLSLSLPLSFSHSISQCKHIISYERKHVPYVILLLLPNTGSINRCNHKNVYAVSTSHLTLFRVCLESIDLWLTSGWKKSFRSFVCMCTRLGMTFKTNMFSYKSMPQHNQMTKNWVNRLAAPGLIIYTHTCTCGMIHLYAAKRAFHLN